MAVLTTLVACGGSNPVSSSPEVYGTTVEAAGTVAFAQPSLFRIRGNNLRSAYVTNKPSFPNACTGLSEKIKTNSEIVFECVPASLSIEFNIINSEDRAVIKPVKAIIPETGIEYTSLTLVTTAKLGGVVRLNIDGQYLENTINTPTSDNCLALKVISTSPSRVVIECVPVALNFSVTVTSTNGNEIGTQSISFSAKPSLIAISGLNIDTNSNQFILNETVTFAVKGLSGNSTNTSVSVPESDCDDYKQGETTEDGFIFSCNLKTLAALFQIVYTDEMNNILARPIESPLNAAIWMRMNTTLGDIDISLQPAKAPITVANFFRYANDGYYNGTIFHRVIKGFVSQGGGFTSQANLQTGEEKDGLRDPITLESTNITGLSNKTNTIAMARTANPNSATSQFYFNAADNTNLDFVSTGQPGYAVFGEVLSDDSVLKAINGVPTKTLQVNEGVPEVDIVINSVTPVSPVDGRF